jgi:hypothetical protein
MNAQDRLGQFDGENDKGRTCDPYPVKAVLSRRRLRQLSENRSIPTAYAAYDFLPSYAIPAVLVSHWDQGVTAIGCAPLQAARSLADWPFGAASPFFPLKRNFFPRILLAAQSNRKFRLSALTAGLLAAGRQATRYRLCLALWASGWSQRY